MLRVLSKGDRHENTGVAFEQLVGGYAQIETFARGGSLRGDGQHSVRDIMRQTIDEQFWMTVAMEQADGVCELLMLSIAKHLHAMPTELVNIIEHLLFTGVHG